MCADAQSLQKLDAMTLDGELGTPVPPEMGVAVEYVGLQPISGNFAAHFGVQSELLYAIPFPGLSALAGGSLGWQLGSFSVAPALSVRGRTDFGVSVANVPLIGVRTGGN